LSSRSPDMPSCGVFRWSPHGNEELTWQRYDYSDVLPMSSARAYIFDRRPRDPEARQCYVLHLAAGFLLFKTKQLSNLPDVQRCARTILDLLMEGSQEPCDLLGDAADTMTQAEADLRVFLHDIRHFSHDKDYRTSAALVLSALKKHCLCFARIDGSYQVSVDTIPGAEFSGSAERCIWLHAAKGHLTLLVPDKPCLPPAFAREIPAVGWQEHLEAGSELSAHVPAPKCSLCDEAPAPKATRTGYELGAFGSSPLPLRVGLFTAAEEGTQAAGSFSSPWNSTPEIALQDVSIPTLPDGEFPGIMHITIGGPPHSTSHLWDASPRISRLHLLSDTADRTTAPARDISAISSLLRKLESRPLDELFVELCPAAGGSPTAGPASKQSIQSVQEHILALATACFQQGSRVTVCAPVTSIVWRDRGTTVTFSGQEWHRFRAPSPREAGTAYSGQQWLWYSSCGTLAGDLRSQKTLEPLQVVMRQSQKDMSEEEPSSKLGGGGAYPPK